MQTGRSSRSTAASKRPTGFGAGSAAPRSAPVADPEAPRTRKKFSLFKRKPKAEKPPRVKKPKVKQPRKKTPRRPIGKTELLIMIGAFILILAIIGALMLIGSTRTVHQMPTILRITEAPTEAPAQSAMLRSASALTAHLL